jgi:hypothetical protein
MADYVNVIIVRPYTAVTRQHGFSGCLNIVCLYVMYEYLLALYQTAVVKFPFFGVKISVVLSYSLHVRHFPMKGPPGLGSRSTVLG